MKKKLLSILLTLCMILAILPATALAAASYYIDESGDRQILTDCTPVTSETTQWEDGGWYIVNNNIVNITGGVTVTGDVKLVLVDGCTLTVTAPTVSTAEGGLKAGIHVAEGNTLTIYGQDLGTGKLIATGGGGSSGSGGGAGIGGNGTVPDQPTDGNCGTVIIYGGHIIATGKSGGAGIGGGGGFSDPSSNTTTNGGNGGVVKIFGGTVEATGNDDGAGIGGGRGGGYSSGVYGTGGVGGSGGKVAICGGTVTANGGFRGAGIGGGAGGTADRNFNGGTGGDGGEIAISGGAITAESAHGAGIGGGAGGLGGAANYRKGGNGGKGSVVTITGGTVTAKSQNGAGIGGGAGANAKESGTAGITLDSYGGDGGHGDNVTISGGTVAASSYYAPGIGGGYSGKGYATSSMKYGAPGRQVGTVKVTGGSVDAKTSTYGTPQIGNSLTRSDYIPTPGAAVHPKDDNGNTLYLTTVTMTGVGKSAEIKEIDLNPSYTYGCEDTKTDKDEKLYLYLPPDSEVRSITTKNGVRYGGYARTNSSGTAAGVFNSSLIVEDITYIGSVDTAGERLILTFNESVDTASSGSVTIGCDDSAPMTLVSPEWSEADTTLTFNIDELEAGKIYTVTVSGFENMVNAEMVMKTKSFTVYNIAFVETSGGSVSFKMDSYPVRKATSGQIITLVETPETGYGRKSNSLKAYLTTDSSTVSLKATNGIYSFTMPYFNVTIKATFAPTYLLNVDLNGGDGGTIGGEYAAGIEISINAGSRPGFRFSGWTSDNGGTFGDPSLASTTFTMPEGDVIITATWEADSGGSEGNTGGSGTTPDPNPNPDPTPTPDPDPDPDPTPIPNPGPDPYPTPTPNPGPDPYPTPAPTPGPSPAEDTFIFTPSLISEMLIQQQSINIENGLQLIAGLESIPRSDADTIIITASEIKDPEKLNDFYKVYPTQQSIRKGYEVTFTVENNNQKSSLTEFSDAITLKFRITPDEVRRIDPNSLVVYKVDDNGVVTGLHGTFDRATLTYTVTTNHLCNFYLMAEEASNEPWINPFIDVKESDWFYSAVEFVNRNGFYMGTGANTFTPNGAMTRAMFWTVLGRVNGQTLSGSGVYDAARGWAMSAGITDGTSPYGDISREQIVTIIWRYAGSPKSDGELSAFSDADNVSDYAFDAMVWAVENGIILGNNGRLMPRDNATRVQAAAIIQRFIEATMK